MVIRIGTWNLENLFKPPNPFAPKTEEEYQAKLDALASAITRMDPHVLAVQNFGWLSSGRPSGLPMRNWLSRGMRSAANCKPILF